MQIDSPLISAIASGQSSVPVNWYALSVIGQHTRRDRHRSLRVLSRARTRYALRFRGFGARLAIQSHVCRYREHTSSSAAFGFVTDLTGLAVGSVDVNTNAHIRTNKTRQYWTTRGLPKSSDVFSFLLFRGNSLMRWSSSKRERVLQPH